jgi:hypothetical protein
MSHHDDNLGETLAALLAINQGGRAKPRAGRGCAWVLVIVGFGTFLLWWLSR